MAYQDVTEGQWLIPQGSGEFFIFPSRDRWPEIIKANQKWTETRWGADLRQRVRKQILDAAISYTQNVLGDYATAAQWAQSDLQQPILVTGHQPRFYHPGVWCKNFVLAQAAQELGAIPINLIVDTDEVGTLEVVLPIFRDDSWSIQRIALMEAKPGETFEVLAAPTKEQISAFLAAIRQVDTAGYQESTRENLNRFTGLLEEMKGQHWAEDLGLAGWQTLLRRRYEGEASYLELPVSHLAELPGFKEYAAHVVKAAPSFVECYNRTLRRYRREHNYRYPVNPFPDLQSDTTGSSYELPFWVIQAGVRQPALTGKDLSNLPLRPRGMLLTLFSRLFYADLFLHGIGGAKYDGATSVFIQEYYGVEPPTYAAATLTLWPELTVSTVNRGDWQRLEELVRDIEFNPDRYLAAAGLSQAEQVRLEQLVARKQELIELLQKPGVDRKKIGLEIKDINQVVGASLATYKEQVNAKLKQIKRALAGNEAAQRRDFPYFLFRPDQVKTLTGYN